MQGIPLGHFKCIWQCSRGLANMNSFSQVSLTIFLRPWMNVRNLTYHGAKRKRQYFNLKKNNNKGQIPTINKLIVAFKNKINTENFHI